MIHLATTPEEKAHQKIKDRDLNIGDLSVEPALGAHWYIKSD